MSRVDRLSGAGWLHVAALLLTLTLGACGVKNEPVPPSEVEAAQQPPS